MKFNLDGYLWKIMQTMNKNSFLKFFVKLLYSSGIIYVYNAILYRHDVNHPTLQMLESKNYFEQNKERIEKNSTQFGDDLSKMIYNNIIKYRITHDSKIRGRYSRKDQYFPKDLIRIQENEVFVDCGAYIGDTIIPFIRAAKYGFKKIIAFEPDVENSLRITMIDERIKVINACVWNEDTTLKFESGLDSSSKICDERGVGVKACKIDSIPECADATFIKMDIEGAEYNALLGAYNTIRNNKPKLAICIYHSDEDMLRIQELIASWNLGYKFFIRHHAQKTSETVLYALCD